MYKANPKTEYKYNKLVADHAKHTFQWSRGTVTCSCGWWTLWHATLESARRSHSYHRANMQSMEDFLEGPHGKPPRGDPK